MTGGQILVIVILVAVFVVTLLLMDIADRDARRRIRADRDLRREIRRYDDDTETQ